MNILIIGSGGREHAIGLALKQSSLKTNLFFAPGNAGTSNCGKNINIKETQLDQLLEFAQKNNITITFVGPEAPLVLGIVDLFKKHNCTIIGPSKTAAQLEGSKQWSKQLMKKYNIPTAAFETFTNFNTAKDYLLTTNTYPIVIKADGLAAGKGVTVAQTEAEAITALEDCFLNNKFSTAGHKVIIEECLVGQEASIFAFTDGKTMLPMIPAQDHKAIYNGDKGPNTGGMGAYCPAPIVTSELQQTINKTIFQPLLQAFQAENLDYTGIVFAGLMISPSNQINVIEFNVRFGDPETQVVLPCLETDLVAIFKAITQKNLSSIQLKWKQVSTVCVVMASGGYPGSYEKNKVIKGLDLINNDCHIIHAGTKQTDDQLVTNGGRVLGVVGQHSELKTAISTTYNAVKNITFDKAYHRTDIGFKAL